MRFCPECGARVDVDSCPFCGTVQSEEAPTNEAPAPAPYSRPVVPGAASPPPPEPRDRAKYILGGIAIAALIGMGGYLAFGSDDGPDTLAIATNTNPGVVIPSTTPTTEADGPTVTETSPATEITPTETDTPSPTPPSLTPDEERLAALATIEDLVSADRATDPIRGQWVAQLASKYEGVVDKSQQPTPFTIPQILAEAEALKSNPDYGSLVRVVHQGDWGQSEAPAKTLWVTFADLDASSRSAIVDWCEGHFMERGQSLLNVCYPRQLHRK